MERRIRCPPFTQEEKYILEEVVGLFSDTIENKRTDATSSRQKREAWVKVTVTYNSYGNVTHRTSEQLRKAWENLKSIRKKKALKSTEETVNGECHPDQSEEPMSLELMHTVDTEYDSDAIYLRTSTLAESSGRPASALASYAYLADTPILDDDFNDADDRDHSFPQSSQDGVGSFPTIQIEGDSTLSSSCGQSKSCGHLDGSGEPFPHSSSGRYDKMMRTGSRTVSLPGCAKETVSARAGEMPPARGGKSAEGASLSSAAKGRMAVLRDEHAARMTQLTAAARQRDELHMIRLREARAVAEAAEARARAEGAHARAELARALDAEEELEYNRKRRRRRSPFPS